MRTQPIQFEIIVQFMEKYGDLSRASPDSSARLLSLKKWLDLVDILNRNEAEPKPLEKWRKVWTDFKNNTRRKSDRIKKRSGLGADLTNIEKRVLKLMEENHKQKSMSTDSDSNLTVVKEKFQETNDENFTASPAPEESNSSAMSNISSTHSSNLVKRRKMSEQQCLNDIVNKFLEFEKEKEKMTHEREMARIRQHDQMLCTFGKIVNVLETLAPSIQRYLVSCLK